MGKQEGEYSEGKERQGRDAEKSGKGGKSQDSESNRPIGPGDSDRGTKAWLDPESAEMPIQNQMTREELRKALPERPALKPSASRQTAFPGNAEIEFERSVIRIPFHLKGKGEKRWPGRRIDIMVFDAYMRLIREAPIRNGLGFRQFEFYIDAWELTNTHSEGLNADITFRLSDTVQPKSLCIAQQRDSDYPAMIVYNAIYDVYIGKERIVTNQAGTAVAMPVWEIPPRNVTVAFEKPFDSDLFAFRPGCCEGMRSITREEFLRGEAEALALRGLK